jgi:hypothetical protein
MQMLHSFLLFDNVVLSMSFTQIYNSQNAPFAHYDVFIREITKNPAIGGYLCQL